jgi:hypothetical protein
MGGQRHASAALRLGMCPEPIVDEGEWATRPI